MDLSDELGRGRDGYDELCARIRAHCAARGWYGSDMALRMLVHRHGRQDDALRHGFACPPADEADVGGAEAQLGFALPAALRAVYTQVANGGFGPGYGLVGVAGGHPAEGVGVLKSRRPTLADTVAPVGWRLSERAALLVERRPDLYLECETLPGRFVALCHWGCGIYSYLDGWTGRVYLVTPVGRADPNTGDPSDPYDLVGSLEHEATSVETWLSAWLEGSNALGRSVHAEREERLESDLDADAGEQARSPFDDPDFLDWWEWHRRQPAEEADGPA